MAVVVWRDSIQAFGVQRHLRIAQVISPMDKLFVRTSRSVFDEVDIFELHNVFLLENTFSTRK